MASALVGSCAEASWPPPPGGKNHQGRGTLVPFTNLNVLSVHARACTGLTFAQTSRRSEPYRDTGLPGARGHAHARLTFLLTSDVWNLTEIRVGWATSSMGLDTPCEQRQKIRGTRQVDQILALARCLCVFPLPGQRAPRKCSPGVLNGSPVGRGFLPCCLSIRRQRTHHSKYPGFASCAWTLITLFKPAWSIPV